MIALRGMAFGFIHSLLSCYVSTSGGPCTAREQPDSDARKFSTCATLTLYVTHVLSWKNALPTPYSDVNIIILQSTQ
jgi:hypothetical protein